MRRALKRLRTIALLGESSDPQAAVRAISERRPALVLVNLHPVPATIFGAGSRLPLLRDLRACSPESKLFVIAREVTVDEALALHELRFEGVVSWRELSQNGISSRLRALLDGARIRNSIFEDALCERAQPPTQPLAPALSLEEIERSVLEGLAAGKSEDAIARSVPTSAGTVKRILKRLETRLDAANRPNLVSIAWERGLLTKTPDE